MKPRLLDLFCGAGGCTAGYQRAGFWVRGVDIKRQPRYCGEEFIQADALEYLAGLIESGEIEEFDAIHASPPCQRYTKAARIHQSAMRHPDLVEPTREMLERSGRPYVMENVMGAPLNISVMLCGLMFGLRVLRHRLFESSLLLLAPFHPKHPDGALVHARGSYDRGQGRFVCVVGHNFCPKAGSAAMGGLDWMLRDEMAEAIPPAYTEFIGRQLIEAIQC
jgi:DNA (cytosine-5)-methyltransferase 1